MQKWSQFGIHLDDLEILEDLDIELEDGEKLNIASDSPEFLVLECPKCHSKKNNKENATLYVNKVDESWFCNHCGYAGNLIQGVQPVPTNNHFEAWKLNPFLSSFHYEDNLINVVIENFNKKKITRETLQHFKVSQGKIYFPEVEENLLCLIYPYYQENRLCNLVYSNKNNSSEIGGVVTCFNFDKIDLEETIIVMDELEVFTFYECEKTNVISLFNGYSTTNLSVEKIKNTLLEFLSNVEDKLTQVKKIKLALPSTERGNILKEELIRRLGKEKCWVVQPPEQDCSWNDILVDYGKQKLLYLLDTATAIPVRGLVHIGDIEDKLDELYYKGLRKGYSTGFEAVDQFYTVVPGQWTVMTGIPGHGKSNFLDAVMINLAKNDDWHFGIFSPENQPVQRHFAGLLEKYYNKPFDLGKPNRITEEEKELGKKWLDKHFSVILPHVEDSWSIDNVLELAKVLVFRKGIKGLIIDPWNELDHSRPNTLNETEYVSLALTKLRQFARNYDVHVWLVAHPAKLYKDKEGKYPVPTPYDISGSAHYRNKADNAVTVWRNVGYEDESIADIHVQKIRFKEVGRVGLCSLRFDRMTNSLIDDVDQDKRQKALEDGIVLSINELKKPSF